MTGVLLESSGYRSESLDVVEVNLDEITLFVGLAVQSRLFVPSWMSTDDRLHSEVDPILRTISKVG